MANDTIDTNSIIEEYLEQLRRETDNSESQARTAEGFSLQKMDSEESNSHEDVLVIDQNLKGIQYQLAQCCHPIYGDDIFGFVSIKRGIMIHRTNCPNAHDMRERYGYRIVKARWAGKSVDSQYPITLMVVGHDDIGIVTNITSIINKEVGINLRSISIEANDGLFSGQLTVMVSDTSKLNTLIKKLKTVKGVKNVSRL